MTDTDLAQARAPGWRNAWAATLPAGRDIAVFLGITAQLGALLFLLRLLEIEPGSGLPRILPLVFVGFVVHAALPLRYRLPFFLALSLAAFGLVLGPLAALLLTFLGLVILGLCHLPLAFSVRVLLLVAFGGAMVALRQGWTPGWLGTLSSLAPRVLPVLGSIFMFRLLIYLYDLRHEEREQSARKPGAVRAGAPPNIWERLSYFFLLPNVCFLLFPIVDWRTYRRTYYDQGDLPIYQRGVWWICLGLVHLLMYRVVYHFLVPSPEQVQALGGVVRFMVSSYLIYLRVSGLFHLVTGMLCLFGFNLPPFHRWFFLASGFTDFWRRARIDWKDFMVKVFYFPAFKPLQRRWGLVPAMFPATVAVFVATWLLHSWQWFWLRGDFRFSQADAVFWAVFGACVLVNSLLEATRRRKPRAGWSLGSSTARAFKVIGMFAFLSVLWSYWSSPSFAIWWSTVSAAGESGPGAYAVLLASITAAVATGVLAQFLSWRFTAARSGSTRSPAPFAAMPRHAGGWRPLAVTLAAGVLLLVGVPAGRGELGETLTQVAGTLGSHRLNAVDQEREDRGYYETLLDAPRSTVSLAAGAAEGEVQDEKAMADLAAPAPAGRREGRLGRRDRAPHDRTIRRMIGGVLGYELKPGYHGQYKRASFHTNSWGMRDKEYTLSPPPNTYRIALIGSSFTMGAGVPMEETHEWLLEERLNREGPGVPRRKYEILNFAVGGYGILQNVVVVEEKVFRLEPDALLVVIQSVELSRMVKHVVAIVQEGADIPYPYVREQLRKAGVEPDMEEPELQRRIRRVAPDLVRWSYRRINETSRRRGAPVVGITLPTPGEGRDRALPMLAKWAEEAGLTIVSLEGVYDGHSFESVRLSDRDIHLNALGHRLVADRLYELLRVQDDRLFRLGFDGD